MEIVEDRNRGKPLAENNAMSKDITMVLLPYRKVESNNRSNTSCLTSFRPYFHCPDATLFYQTTTVAPRPQVSNTPSGMPAFLHASASRCGGSRIGSVVRTQVLGKNKG